MKQALALLGLFAATCASSAAQRLPLATWSFRSHNGSVHIDNVRVPGTSHTHLIDAGVIEDPCLRFNERAYQWIARETWIYETQVDIAEHDALARSKLVFEQLDGVTQVFVNDQLLASTHSAFVPHAFDIEKQLQRGRNAIKVVFTPPLDYARAQSKWYPYPVPATQNFNTWAEPTHRSFIRKAGSDFGWDWGPAFATTGMAGSAYIELGASTPELRDLAVEQRFPHTNLSVAHVTVRVAIDTKGASHDNVTFSLLIDGTLRASTTAHVGSSSDDTDEIALHATLENPTLWWPAGYGEPHLYDVTVTAANARFRTSLAHKVGVRRVELVQEPTSAGNVTGETFYFRVNNVPIFIKGANWIPTDSFPTRVAPATVRNLIRSAFEANMNMIRVWGGGRYESELFYSECDRLGLLVWQELMFACGMYPRDTAFLKLVHDEVRVQVKRLRKFTSIAMWGGNNENENMMEQFAVNDFVPGWAFNRDIAVADYSKLFVDVIPPIVAALDSTRPFVDTSPSNGLYSVDPFVKRWGPVNSVAYGDVHFYDYVSDCQEAETFPNARFISEFGFQSAPSLLSLQDVAGADDTNSFQAFWSFLKFRERHENGTAEMLRQLERRFVVPFPFSDEAWLTTPFAPQAHDNTASFGIDVAKRIDAYLYLTQLQQGLCYQTAIRKWRRGKREDLGRTMGILYWQLNDIWQGTSWSSVEFSGRWKTLHYVVKREFAPLLLSVHLPKDSDRVEIFGVSDVDRALAINVVYEVRSVTSGALLSTTTDNVALANLESKRIRGVRVADVLRPNETACTVTTCFLMIHCRTATLSAREAASSCRDVHQFFAPIKSLALARGSVAILNVTHSTAAPQAIDVMIRSSAFVALFVALETTVARGFWSDSAFLMLANETRVLTFTPLEHEDDEDLLASLDSFRASLRVKWLQQIYDNDSSSQQEATSVA